MSCRGLLASVLRQVITSKLQSVQNISDLLSKCLCLLGNYMSDDIIIPYGQIYHRAFHRTTVKHCTGCTNIFCCLLKPRRWKLHFSIYRNSTEISLIRKYNLLFYFARVYSTLMRDNYHKNVICGFCWLPCGTMHIFNSTSCQHYCKESC